MDRWDSIFRLVVTVRHINGFCPKIMQIAIVSEEEWTDGTGFSGCSEIPENLCCLFSPARNFRNILSNGKRPKFLTANVIIYDKRQIEVEGNPKATFSLACTVTYGFYHNSRQGWALLQSRCMHNLFPVILHGIRFTSHELMESRVNFGAHELGFELQSASDISPLHCAHSLSISFKLVS